MRRQAGMTLLEVLVAMSILAIAATAVLKTAGESLNSITQLREKTFALWVAENRMAEIKLAQEWPAATRKGEVELAEVTWYWQSEGLETPDKDFIGVRVSVSSDKEGKRVLAELMSYLGR